MRKLYFKILISLTPLIALYLVDFVYSQVAMQSNYAPIEMWYDLMHGKIDADVIAMGNSRTHRHISPIILDSILNIKTYNMGMIAGTFNRQYHKYDLYRRNNSKPKFIIQTIDYTTLKYEVGFQKEQFFPYFWNKSMRSAFFSIEPLSLQEKYLPLYRYIGQPLWIHSNPRSQIKGFEALDDPWNGDAYSKIQSFSFQHSESNDKLFDSYLARNKSEGIKIIFVYTPIYIGATDKMSNQGEMYAFYRRYAEKYDIPILDYTYMDICFDTTYFANALHLNRKGAELFSDSLANDLKKMGLGF